MKLLLLGAMVGAATLAGCGKADKASTGCKTDNDCKGDRVCVAGSCADPAAKGVPLPGPSAPGGAAAPAPAPPTPGMAGADNDEGEHEAERFGGTPADDDACAAVVAHLAELVQQDAEIAAGFDPAKHRADCASKRATTSHLACLMKASTIPATADCDRAEFAGVDVPTAVGQEFGPGESRPGGSQDGDYLMFRDTDGRKCGFLFREHHWASAMFVMCGGAIISSPLTSAADIREVSALLADQQRREHEIVKSIMDNYPYGRATKVYDQNGIYQGTRY
jgi:hypothetical protein